MPSMSSGILSTTNAGATQNLRIFARSRTQGSEPPGGGPDQRLVSGALPGLGVAAVGAVDRGLDRRLEHVPAVTVVDRGVERWVEIPAAGVDRRGVTGSRCPSRARRGRRARHRSLGGSRGRRRRHAAPGPFDQSVAASRSRQHSSPPTTVGSGNGFAYGPISYGLLTRIQSPPPAAPAPVRSAGALPGPAVGESASHGPQS